MGVIGDLSDAFPNGTISNFYRADWLTAMIKDTRQNREFQSRTIDTARWAREQVKRQIGGTQSVQAIQQTWSSLIHASKNTIFNVSAGAIPVYIDPGNWWLFRILFFDWSYWGVLSSISGVCFYHNPAVCLQHYIREDRIPPKSTESKRELCFATAQHV